MSNRELDIYNYLLKYETFTKKDYEDLCNEYGKDKVSEFINNFVEKADNTLNQNEIDNFLSKYSILFDEAANINNEETTVKEYIDLNGKLPEIVTQYLRNMDGVKLFTVEEEKAIFTKFSNLKEELSIITIQDTSIIDIDYASIFMSIKDERQIKALIKLYKANYAPKGTNYYEKVLNSKKDRDIIEKYLKLYTRTNHVLSSKELTTNFKEINFNKYNLLDSEEFDRQLNDLTEFLTLFKKIQYSNLRLVFSIAKKYAVKRGSLLDFIQEGNINGLTKAILRFDINKGYKFSTYANWWIMQSVTRYSKNNGDTIRKPVHMGEKIAKYKRAYERLMMTLGRDPSKEELSEATGFTIDECLEIEKVSLEPASLDTPVGEEEKTRLMDFVSTDELVDEETVEEKYEKKALKEAIEKVLENLKPKEAEILRLRFGMNDSGDTMTLGDIGEIYGITRERVRQIEMKALKKLRQPNNAKYLKDFTE